MSAPRHAHVTGWGRYAPAQVLTNADLERMVDTNDEWIRTRTGIRERRVAAAHETTASMGAVAAPESPPARPAISAPLTGIFYASPAPGSAPYVQVGGEVAVGQVIGLIEAMKLFNEIKSDLAGRVVKVVAESGALVKAKQPLIEVEPL